MDNFDSGSDSSANGNIPTENAHGGLLPVRPSENVETISPTPLASTSTGRTVPPGEQFLHRRIQEMIAEHRREQAIDSLTQEVDDFRSGIYVSLSSIPDDDDLENYRPVDLDQMRHPETDVPASGDNTRRDLYPMNLPAVTSSGYLGSNESSSDGSSTSTASVGSAYSEESEPLLGVTNDIDDLIMEANKFGHTLWTVTPSPNSVEENAAVRDLDNSQSQSSSQAQNSENSVDESSSPGQTSEILTVNATNPDNDWPWDQRELHTPESLVDETEAESGPDMIGYMQKLMNSPSEEMFSRPASASTSAVMVPPKKRTRPLFRSISCPILAVPDNPFKYGNSRSDPNIRFHEVVLDHDIDAMGLKRSKSLDTLKNYLRQSNSKGDYLKVESEVLTTKGKPEADDSGENSPDGSSVRSKRIDNLLCSLFALCVGGKQAKEKESLGVETFDQSEVNIPEESIPRAARGESTPGINFLTSTGNFHKDNVKDILDYVHRVAASNFGQSYYDFYTTKTTTEENVHCSNEVEPAENLEMPWKRCPGLTPKNSKQNFQMIGADHSNIPETKFGTECSSSDRYLSVKQSKFVVDLKSDRIEQKNFGAESGVGVLCEMDPKKSKGVKFEDCGKKKPVVANQKSESNYELTSSASQSEECVEIVKFPRDFRMSREFSRKEERLRPNSTELQNRDEIESKMRPRTVTFQDSCPQRRSTPLRRSLLEPKSSVESLATSDDDTTSTQDRKNANLVRSVTSELFLVKGELADRSNLIDYSVDALEQLLSNLQNLWLNSNEGSKIPTLPENTGGEHRLTQLTNLCSFIVKEMESDWESYISERTDPQKLTKLEESNRYLKEQLESCRVIQGCLESEINYVAKEKVLLNEEVKHLSLHLAKLEMSLRSPPGSTKQDQSVGTTYSPSPKPRTRTVSQQSSKDSIGFCVTITEADCESITMTDANENIVKKREDEFNSIMDFFRERGSDFNYYQEQLDKYDEEVSTLKRQVEITAAERAEMKHAYDTLSQEHKDLVRERGHYEGVLKLILQEKQTNEHSLQDLMEILIQKLNGMSEDGNAGVVNSSRLSLLEGALQAVQEQNVNYREEVEFLKQRLTETLELSATEKSELEANLTQAVQNVDELKTNLSEKTQEFSDYQKKQDEKLKKMEDVRLVITQAKTQLEKALIDKEEEIKKIQETMQNLQKNGLRQQKKINEFQKINSRLSRDIVEQKHNLESLNNIVHQLRSNLKEQKVQWAERIKSSGDEAKQTKDHCKWLQAQIEHLNGQLKDAHERMKAHEKDKSTLAQQVLAAEEERKVIDRRFQELRTAMAGDLVLRQALAERNEALTSEITRMRRQKLLKMGGNAVNEELEMYNALPSEISAADTMSSLNSLAPVAIYHTEGDKGLPIRNRYIAVTAPYGSPHVHNHSHRRMNANESPRNAVSMHVPGVSTQGNRKC